MLCDSSFKNLDKPMGLGAIIVKFLPPLISPGLLSRLYGNNLLTDLEFLISLYYDYLRIWTKKSLISLF
jgi:hypothetical protein